MTEIGIVPSLFYMGDNYEKIGHHFNGGNIVDNND